MYLFCEIKFFSSDNFHSIRDLSSNRLTELPQTFFGDENRLEHL